MEAITFRDAPLRVVGFSLLKRLNYEQFQYHVLLKFVTVGIHYHLLERAFSTTTRSFLFQRVQQMVGTRRWG